MKLFEINQVQPSVEIEPFEDVNIYDLLAQKKATNKNYQNLRFLDENHVQSQVIPQKVPVRMDSQIVYVYPKRELQNISGAKNFDPSCDFDMNLLAPQRVIRLKDLVFYLLKSRGPLQMYASEYLYKI